MSNTITVTHESTSRLDADAGTTEGVAHFRKWPAGAQARLLDPSSNRLLPVVNSKASESEAERSRSRGNFGFGVLDHELKRLNSVANYRTVLLLLLLPTGVRLQNE